MRLYKHILIALLILLFASPACAWMNAAIVGGGGADMTPDVLLALSVPAVPAVSASTSVIAETPVAPDAIALSVPALPSVLASTVVKYAVTYAGNGNTGGSVPTDSNWYASGATVTVLGNTGTLTKTGYTWTCWNTQADGGGTDYNPAGTFELTAGTTLYAKWTAE
jgi:hypothetical protein